tara:strand:+ start:971 stop:1504 length:534 start_codon:yes stop_codon:yes gene_type:complete
LKNQKVVIKMKKWSKFVENTKNPVYVVGIVACLNKKKQFLLVKRSKTDKLKPGYWEWPGGHIDPEDASIEAGAARELEEEANLKCHPDEIKFLGYQEIKRPQVEDKNIEITVKRYYFLATEWGNEPKIVPNPVSGILEHDDIKWATREEIKSIDNTEIPDYLLDKALKIAGFEVQDD